uniref:Uncharacterized protein n=1 Tax=Monopterus albus TaxID=43700 RepID=A0A3Q3ILK8_MONAL
MVQIQIILWTLAQFVLGFIGKEVHGYVGKKGQHFVIRYRTALINRESETGAILDKLLEWGLICQERYGANHTTMRSVFLGQKGLSYEYCFSKGNLIFVFSLLNTVILFAPTQAARRPCRHYCTLFNRSTDLTYCCFTHSTH